MLPPSSKQALQNKMETLNLVIISSQFNSTLTRCADVMEKSLGVTATSIKAQPAPSPFSQMLSMPSQCLGPTSTLSSTSSSDSEILDKAIRIVTADKDFLSEDDLLAASLFFSNTSSDVVCVTRTFIAFSDKPAVQHQFLMCQLEDAGLCTRKEKGKTTMNDDDDFLISC